MFVRTIRHPLSGATYDLTDRGTILVARGSETGEFTEHGRWISGPLRHADPHLCLWIAGRQLPNRFQQAAQAMNDAS